MKARSLIAVGALVIAGGAAVIPSAGAKSPTTTDVRLIHGLGPGSIPVDVYVGEGASPTEWDLLVEDLEYGENVEIEDLDAGTYNALFCDSVDGPPDTITSCLDLGELGASASQAAVNGNSGSPFVLDPDTVTAVVLAYGGPDSSVPGRPTVAAFPLVDACLSPTDNRGQLLHAAAADPVDVLGRPAGSAADPALLGEDLEFGETGEFVMGAGNYDLFVELTDATPLAEALDVEFEPLNLTYGVFVGNPQWEADYEILIYDIEVDPCLVTSTTFPPSSSTTATAAPSSTSPSTTTAAARSATATPTFTG